MYIRQRSTFSSYTPPTDDALWYWFFDVDNGLLPTPATDGLVRGGTPATDYIDLGGNDGWLILT